MCIHRNQPLCRRMRSKSASRLVRWYRFPVWVSARDFNRVLGRVRNVLSHVALQYRLEDFQHHSNSDWSGFRCNLISVSREVSSLLSKRSDRLLINYRHCASPRHLLEKHPDQPERALAVLAKIRSGSPTDERIRAEMHELVASYEYRKRYEPGYLGLLKSKAMLKRLCYGFYAMALQQFGGIAALTMYATLIYKSLGWDAGHQVRITWNRSLTNSVADDGCFHRL